MKIAPPGTYYDREYAIIIARDSEGKGPTVPEAHRKKYQNTTVRLPRRVYERTKIAIQRSHAASSFNEFVVQAIEEKLHTLTDSEIDSAFAGMASDPNYQRDSVALAKEFEQSDGAAWRATEKAHERSKARTSKTRSR